MDSLYVMTVMLTALTPAYWKSFRDRLMASRTCLRLARSTQPEIRGRLPDLELRRLPKC